MNVQCWWASRICRQNKWSTITDIQSDQYTLPFVYIWMIQQKKKENNIQILLLLMTPLTCFYIVMNINVFNLKFFKEFAAIIPKQYQTSDTNNIYKRRIHIYTTAFVRGYLSDLSILRPKIWSISTIFLLTAVSEKLAYLFIWGLINYKAPSSQQQYHPAEEVFHFINSHLHVVLLLDFISVEGRTLAEESHQAKTDARAHRKMPGAPGRNERSRSRC